MNEFIEGEINNYCEAVSMGCKPCAMFPIQDRYVEEVKKIIDGKALFVYAEFLYPNWTTVWIYKREFMLDVIKKILTLFPPEKPNTIFDHWILGKAFGYSDEAIEEFLSSFKKSSIAFGAGR
ncbi:unnamed protein product [marine sediment metagenome]|uniref:Uncharacterized protein n=1 Tax=marine sediment metagenome TaxID=412755 RepID=X1DRP8_9ZZZZ